jgi:hypothetical protein
MRDAFCFSSAHRKIPNSLSVFWQATGNFLPRGWILRQEK